MPPSARRILDSVAAKHGLTVEDLVGSSARKAATRARWEAMARLRDEVRINGLEPSLPQVGTWVRRDHTTVLHGLMRQAQLVAAAEAVRISALAGVMRSQLAFDMAERAGL